jgi:hypothetical protein
VEFDQQVFMHARSSVRATSKASRTMQLLRMRRFLCSEVSASSGLARTTSFHVETEFRSRVDFSSVDQVDEKCRAEALAARPLGWMRRLALDHLTRSPNPNAGPSSTQRARF